MLLPVMVLELVDLGLALRRECGGCACRGQALDERTANRFGSVARDGLGGIAVPSTCPVSGEMG